jgi:PAS domain S-box-containing protein
MAELQNFDASLIDLTDPKLLSAVLEAANDAIVITDADVSNSPYPRIVYANDAYLRMSGYALAEVIGKSPRILQGPDTCRATSGRIRQKLEAWEPFREEVLNYRKDGPLSGSNSMSARWRTRPAGIRTGFRFNATLRRDTKPWMILADQRSGSG